MSDLVPGRESRFDTPHGEARMVTARARRPAATLLLSHGAGRRHRQPRPGGARRVTCPATGSPSCCFEQPWVLAGRKVATPPPTLDVGLRAAAARLRSAAPLVVGGRSAGARSAARCATGLGAAGCLALAFPLHPPGRPEKSRLDELVGAGVPTLVVQGERDTLGRPRSSRTTRRHGRRPRRRPRVQGAQGAARSRQEDAMGIVVEATLEWIVREVVGESSGT